MADSWSKVVLTQGTVIVQYRRWRLLRVSGSSRACDVCRCLPTLCWDPVHNGHKGFKVLVVFLLAHRADVG